MKLKGTLITSIWISVLLFNGASQTQPIQKDTVLIEPEKDTVYIMKSHKTSTPPKNKDTVVILSSATISDFIGKAEEIGRSARIRGFGGCIGPHFGMVYMDMKPIKNIISPFFANHSELYSLIDNYEPISFVGGQLYGGVGNGTRVGLLGSGGARNFLIPSTNQIKSMNMGIGYGGLLLEKSIVADNFNIIIGGLGGAGGIGLNFTEDALIDTSNFEKDKSVGAAFWILGAHAGTTYSVLPWLHIGGDLGGLFFISSWGFSKSNGIPLSDPFTTVNPSFRIRIVLGNLG